MHFLERNDSNFIEICSQDSNWQYASIGLGNGLALNRWQAVTWTNDDPVHLRIYAALGGDELMFPSPPCHRRRPVVHFSTTKPQVPWPSQHHTKRSHLSTVGGPVTPFSWRHEGWLLTRRNPEGSIKLLSNAFEQSKQGTVVLHDRPSDAMGAVCVQDQDMPYVIHVIAMDWCKTVVNAVCYHQLLHSGAKSSISLCLYIPSNLWYDMHLW